MGIIFDIILIAIVALNIFICYKKGLVKLAVGLIAVVVSIILAVILYKPVSNLIIEKTQIDENIKEAIIENFTSEDSAEEKEDDGFMKYIESYVDDTVNKTCYRSFRNNCCKSNKCMCYVRYIYYIKSNFNITNICCRYNNRITNFKTI